MDGRPDAQRAKGASEILAGKLSKWSLCNSTGKDVSISAANVRKLTPKLFKRLMGIVWGDRASDVDPAWTEDQKKEFAGEPGVIREASDEGN